MGWHLLRASLSSSSSLIVLSSMSDPCRPCNAHVVRTYVQPRLGPITICDIRTYNVVLVETILAIPDNENNFN